MEKKTTEEKVKEQQADNLMGFIVAKTFARHAELSEEEFLKEIGFEGSGKTEEEAVRIAKFNVLVEATKQLLNAKQTIKSAHALMKTYLVEESVVENEKEGE